MTILRLTPALLLLCIACGKSPVEAADKAPAPAAAATAQSAPARETVNLTPEKAKAFLGYQSKYYEIYQTYQKAMIDSAHKAKASGALGLVRAGKELGATGEDLEQNTAAARKEAGLNKAEVDALSRIMARVVTLGPNSDQEYKKLQAQRAQQAQGLAKLPPEARAQIEQTIAAGAEMTDRMFNLTDLRAEYGSPTIDAMIVQRAELVPVSNPMVPRDK